MKKRQSSVLRYERYAKMKECDFNVLRIQCQAACGSFATLCLADNGRNSGHRSAVGHRGPGGPGFCCPGNMTEAVNTRRSRVITNVTLNVQTKLYNRQTWVRLSKTSIQMVTE